MTRGLGVLLVLCLGACRQEPERSPEAMSFAVDPARLGTMVEAERLALRFQPPAGWQALPADQVDSLAHAVSTPGEGIALRPLYVFLERETGNLLTVSRLQVRAGTSFEEKTAAYRAVLADTFTGDSLRQAEFEKDGIHMVQFLVQPEHHVNFKLLFENRPDSLVQFDYILPRERYAENVKALESSIGSIRRL